ncbi:MAG: plastocyanin [Methanolobus sp.]|nr:plastocyanin [Methanolobus sp.]
MNTKLITKLITLILISGFLILAGCLENVYERDTSVSDIESGVTIVYIDNFSFNPESVTIAEGETVRWISNDTAALVISGSSFQSPALRRGDSYDVTFNARGTYNYYLLSHPWTGSGMVIVE